MRAVVVTGPQRVAVDEVGEPEPDGRAVVRLQQAGLCGTDLKILDGDIPVAYPRVMGHELVGEVVTPGGAGDWPAGQRVLIDPTVACGRCRTCRHDRAHLCPNGGLMGRDLDGGFAEHVAVSEQQLLAVPEELPDADAALLQVLGTCVHGQRLVEAFPGHTGVVIGLGVSGLLHVQLLRLRGFDPVIGISRSPAKLELAQQVGATAAVTPDEAAAAVTDVLGGRGPDLVVESVGKIATLGQAVSLAPLGGTILGFGTISATAGELPFYDLYYKELALINARSARWRDYERAIQLAAGGGLQLAPLVSATYPLDAAAEAFAALRDGGGDLKVMLDVAGGRASR